MNALNQVTLSVESDYTTAGKTASPDQPESRNESSGNKKKVIFRWMYSGRRVATAIYRNRDTGKQASIVWVWTDRTFRVFSNYGNFKNPQERFDFSDFEAAKKKAIALIK